jgi:long-subunit fatty acid transport protein
MLRYWSEYLNRQGERPLPGYEWGDTLSGALGVRYAYGGLVAAYLDFAYAPTPVPLQTGRTNYVDNDRYGFGGGVTYTWPIEAWDMSLRFGAQGQFHMLAKRHQTKVNPLLAPGNTSVVLDEVPADTTDSNGDTHPDAQGLQTNNPGWPGFSSSGTLVGGTLSVGLLY